MLFYSYSSPTYGYLSMQGHFRNLCSGVTYELLHTTISARTYYKFLKGYSGHCVEEAHCSMAGVLKHYIIIISVPLQNKFSFYHMAK